MTLFSRLQFITFLTSLILVYVINGASIYSTDIIWSTSSNTYYRPLWSGDVTITYDEWVGQIPGQIWKVQGIVLPISTTGRPSAPDPWNGYPTGIGPGLDKGHIMALSNGGPDISRNIVPQSAQWQRTGGWRQLEIAVYNFAVNKYEWNTIPHASQVEYIEKPNSCLVIFSVDIIIYDSLNGQPLIYEGDVTCGLEKYSFTISPPPGDDYAEWFPIPPPGYLLNNMDFNTTNYTDNHHIVSKDTEIQNDFVGFIIGGICILFCIMFGFILRKKYQTWCASNKMNQHLLLNTRIVTI